MNYYFAAPILGDVMELSSNNLSLISVIWDNFYFMYNQFWFVFPTQPLLKHDISSLKMFIYENYTVIMFLIQGGELILALFKQITHGLKSTGPNI